MDHCHVSKVSEIPPFSSFACTGMNIASTPFLSRSWKLVHRSTARLMTYQVLYAVLYGSSSHLCCILGRVSSSHETVVSYFLSIFLKGSLHPSSPFGKRGEEVVLELRWEKGGGRGETDTLHHLGLSVPRPVAFSTEKRGEGENSDNC